MRATCWPVLVLAISACGGSGGSSRARQATGGAGGGPATGGAGGAGGNAGNAGARRADCTFQGFASPVAYTPTQGPRTLLATDLTGDGRLDIVIVESRDGKPSLELLTNLGAGAFSLGALPVGIKPNAGALVAADFDGDGIVDLASQSNSSDGIDLATNDGVLGLDFGTGRGVLASQAVTIATPQTVGRLAAGDFDGDGRPDLAFAGFDYVESGGFVTPDGRISLPAPEPTNFALNVFRNAGGGSFAAPVSYANPSYFQDVATGDFDGDDHLDVAVLASSAAGMVGVYFNAGDGSFVEEATFSANPDWTGYGLGVADFNGDGVDDLATTTILHPNASDESIVLEVFSGARDRALAVTTTKIAAVPDVYQVATGDFNGDGKPDVALALAPAGRGGSSPPIPITIFQNQGDGTFAAPVVYDVAGTDEPLTNALVAGDFNGDGVTDLALATTGRFTPYPLVVNVLLSRCEPLP